MPEPNLVLSLFPGIGLLDMAFEEEGFCVVRGPDVLWGGDIRRFHPPAGVFDGVIGGPPCQSFSSLVHLIRSQGREPRFGNLIPEFERCVAEAKPRWWLMENVPSAPEPAVAGYEARSIKLNNRWFPDNGGIGAEQNRTRRITFGSLEGQCLTLEVAALESPLTFVSMTQEAVNNTTARRAAISGNGFLSGSQYALQQNQAVTAVSSGHGKQRDGRGRDNAPPAVTSNVGGGSVDTARLTKAAMQAVSSSDGAGKVRQIRYTLAEACRLQGLPEDFLADAPFTAEGKLKAVANGVPLPMGRAIARAVQRAMAGVA